MTSMMYYIREVMNRCIFYKAHSNYYIREVMNLCLVNSISTKNILFARKVLISIDLTVDSNVKINKLNLLKEPDLTRLYLCKPP